MSTIDQTVTAVTTEMPIVYTKADVLLRAAEIANEKGVGRTSNHCVLQRLAEAHHEITGTALSWGWAGETYFGADVDGIWWNNDSAFRGWRANSKRRKWAVNLLRDAAARA